MKEQKPKAKAGKVDKKALAKTWDNVKYVGQWAYKLRSVLLAIPVVIGAIALAVQNMAKLPAQVGINLQASGEYSMVVSRGVAVFAPLGVTAVCLLFMFCSRRVIYPWLISLFSLALPLLLLLTNTFPY